MEVIFTKRSPTKHEKHLKKSLKWLCFVTLVGPSFVPQSFWHHFLLLVLSLTAAAQRPVTYYLSNMLDKKWSLSALRDHLTNFVPHSRTYYYFLLKYHKQLERSALISGVKPILTLVNQSMSLTPVYNSHKGGSFP